MRPGATISYSSSDSKPPTPYGCRLLAADWVFTTGGLRSFDDPLAVLPKVP